MERRFDVRVPLANTRLLKQLESDKEETGIVESRLIVLYATKYVEMVKGGLLPGLPSSGTLSTQNHRNGHTELNGAAPSSLDGAALDTMFGDPD
jgi:hypothetical protein